MPCGPCCTLLLWWPCCRLLRYAHTHTHTMQAHTRTHTSHAVWPLLHFVAVVALMPLAQACTSHALSPQLHIAAVVETLLTTSQGLHISCPITPIAHSCGGGPPHDKPGIAHLMPCHPNLPLLGDLLSTSHELQSNLSSTPAALGCCG